MAEKHFKPPVHIHTINRHQKRNKTFSFFECIYIFEFSMQENARLTWPPMYVCMYVNMESRSGPHILLLILGSKIFLLDSWWALFSSTELFTFSFLKCELHTGGEALFQWFKETWKLTCLFLRAIFYLQWYKGKKERDNLKKHPWIFQLGKQLDLRNQNLDIKISTVISYL